jgi:hypothetical protein
MYRFSGLFAVFCLLLLVQGLSVPANAQARLEPELAEMERPLSPRDFDIRNGMGFRMQLNNFGFGIGAEYRRVLSRYTKGFIEFQINNVRDESEQSFQGYWGYTVIPNKHNRVMSFPVMLGLSRRLFAESLSDNFRLFVQASGGVAPAFVYPYYDHDMFNMGFRPQFQGLSQQHYDVFQGWGQGNFIFGAAGQLSIGANLGGDFGNIQSIRIGYFFNYFPDGIQIMEPFRPGDNISDFNFNLPPEQQAPGVLERAAGKQSFFGTPHITFVFGSMW